MPTAFLYCLYNNLAYTNLATFDPTTYFLLLQLRVGVTGIVFQVLHTDKHNSVVIDIDRRSQNSPVASDFILICLDSVQKDAFSISVVLSNTSNAGLYDQRTEIPRTVFGFLSSFPTKHWDNTYSTSGKTSQAQAWWITYHLTITILNFIQIYNLNLCDYFLLQVFCSSSAGVYNEYLLKKQSQIPLLFQNTCLYFDSVICNLLFLVVQGNLSSGLDLDSLQTIIFTPINLFVVLNNSAIGIVTSFFLSQLNSILKTFASALELLFTAVLCYLIFGIPIYLNTIISIFVVSLAIWVYSRNPVDNRKPVTEITDKDLEKLVSDV